MNAENRPPSGPPRSPRPSLAKLAASGAHPGSVVLDSARAYGFTGEVEFVDEPVVKVYFDGGVPYHAVRSGDPSLCDRLIEADVVGPAQVERGVIRVGSVENLGRLFDRDPSIDRDAVMVVLESTTEEVVGALADVTCEISINPYRHHASGVHRWFVAPSGAARARPAQLTPIGQVAQLDTSVTSDLPGVGSTTGEKLTIEWQGPVDDLEFDADLPAADAAATHGADIEIDGADIEIDSADVDGDGTDSVEGDAQTDTQTVGEVDGAVASDEERAIAAEPVPEASDLADAEGVDAVDTPESATAESDDPDESDERDGAVLVDDVAADSADVADADVGSDDAADEAGADVAGDESADVAGDESAEVAGADVVGDDHAVDAAADGDNDDNDDASDPLLSFVMPDLSITSEAPPAEPDADADPDDVVDAVRRALEAIEVASASPTPLPSVDMSDMPSFEPTGSLHFDVVDPLTAEEPTGEITPVAADDLGLGSNAEAPAPPHTADADDAGDTDDAAPAASQAPSDVADSAPPFAGFPPPRLEDSVEAIYAREAAANAAAAAAAAAAASGSASAETPAESEPGQGAPAAGVASVVFVDEEPDESNERTGALQRLIGNIRRK